MTGRRRPFSRPGKSSGDRMPPGWRGCAILPGLSAFLWSGQPSVLLCLMPALAGAGLYLLGRMLGGVPLLTALSAAGVAVSPDLHPAAGPFVVAVILFYRWMSLPGTPALVGSWLAGRQRHCAAAGGLWAPAVWWCLPVALAPWGCLPGAAPAGGAGLYWRPAGPVSRAGASFACGAAGGVSGLLWCAAGGIQLA